ncbi:hypothetical protein CLOM_g13825 [Closterium sp. NIES-68]|nr:hypothetical protein CLOM_g12884 [Closterium sp. NIES-68]GJP54782.1 hypothetical protein CLOM_g13825 [Closterium sp. NIES-68]
MGARASCGAAAGEGGPQGTCWRLEATPRYCCGTCAAADFGPAGGPPILLWDMRSCRLLGRLEDAHTEDVTQVRFHPLHRTALISASLDGLICRFDLSPPHEAALAAPVTAERYGDSDPLQ